MEIAFFCVLDFFKILLFRVLERQRCNKAKNKTKMARSHRSLRRLQLTFLTRRGSAEQNSVTGTKKITARNKRMATRDENVQTAAAPVIHHTSEK